MLYIYAMKFAYSFIVPVFNRPEEIDELLLSISKQADLSFEVVIIEDGSTATCQHVINKYSDRLAINYLQKENTGPGDSRNFGMQNANGKFFLILDSDVILQDNYLQSVDDFLKINKIECFGGPDLAHPSFTKLQKAIDFTMTSFLTTGGIRGNKTQIQQYEPRSFNMGISRQLFVKTNGFTNIHPGEDPDLSIRIQKLGYQTAFLASAGVYHKRRISWSKFFQQVYKFGLVRPILFKKHPTTIKPSYFFPSMFSFFLVMGILFSILGFPYLLFVYVFYLTSLGLVSFFKYTSLKISLFSILATLIQFLGYGFGFFKSFLYIHLLRKKPEEQFSFLYYAGKHKF
jgi:glycosyltransferase involved in cell wall biosynthesis